MEVRLGFGGLVAKGVDVGHHVVPESALVLRRRRQVAVVEVGADGRNRLGRNREPEFPLGLGQGKPDPPPAADLVPLAPERLHGRRGIAGAERRLIAGVGHRNERST